MLNKTDLVSPEELAEVEAKIRAINRFADDPSHRACGAADRPGAGPRRIRFESPCWRWRRDFLDGEDEHEHNDDVTSVSFEAARPIDPERFNAWIGLLLQDKGADLLRTKGILSYANDDRRFAFQAVHMIADGDFIGPWKPGEKRVSRLVFIGRNLSRPLLRRGFRVVPGGLGCGVVGKPLSP